MVGKSKIRRGGTTVGAQRLADSGAAEMPRSAGTDSAVRADAHEGAPRVDEGRLLVALQLGEGAPMDVVDRIGSNLVAGAIHGIKRHLEGAR